MWALTKNPSSKILSTSHFFSKLGEFAFETGFAVAIVMLTNADILLIGLVYCCRYLPCVLFSPIGGWLADNYQRKTTLAVAELSKSATALTLFLAFEHANANILFIILASMLMTAADCLHTPTFRAYFPSIVSNEELPAINSALQVIEDIASIAGPLLFSAIAVFLSASYAFVFFAITLLISALCILTLQPLPKTGKSSFRLLSILKDASSNVGKLRIANRPLFAVIFCTTLCAMFATSVVRFILPAALLEHYQSEVVVGYVFSLLALGTVLGGLLYVKFNKTTTARSAIIYWAMYGTLFLLAAIALPVNPYVFLGLLLCVGFIGAFVDIAIITNIQCLSPPEDIGKNFSLYYFTAVFGDAISGLVAGLMFLIAGPATFIAMTLMLSIAPLSFAIKKDNIGEK